MKGFNIFKSAFFMALFYIFTSSAGLAAERHIVSSGRDFDRRQTLVIGKVSEDPEKHYKTLKPIADYAVERMDDLGIRQAKVLFAKDNAMMISYLRQGKVDWITETPFSAITFMKKGKVEILLRRWKKGVFEYHTVFFTRKDSKITNLEDLKGKTIAFEDPGSTSAFLIPAATLIQKGLNLVQLATPREKPPADMVGYVFAINEVNAPTWVFRNLVDAGAFSNLDWDDDDRMIESQKAEIRIFHRTNSIPRGFELVRQDLDPEIKKRLKQILLNSHLDPGAKEALKAYKKTTKFDELDDTASSRLEWIESLSKIMHTKLM
jgi:phosphonate transport system substrate-binding protein